MAALAQKLLGAHPLISMACSMRTVLAHVILIADLFGECIGRSHIGHAHMERGVEHRHVRHIGELLAAVLDNAGFGVVVQRCQRRHLVDLIHNLIGHERRVIEVPAPLHDTVPDGIDCKAGIGNRFEHEPDSVTMIGEEGIGRHLVPSLGVAEDATVHTDALAVALGEDLMRIGIEQLILQARAAGVDDQNVHDAPHTS